MRLTLVLLCASAAALAAGDDGILLPPLPGKAGPPKILIYVHGASINEKNYVTVAQAIQRASHLSLWVGLPHFLGNVPNPITITGAVTGMVKRIGAASQGNFSNPPAPSDVFVAAHSLGGVFSPAVVNKQGYKALLEFGSYVTNGLDITTTKFPVLTLGGELDGLTRASRIAVEFEKMKTLPSELHYVKPVVILPGVCHSQFCEGVNVTSFGTKDLRPDVTWEAAHEAIALASADFLNLVVNGSHSGAAAAKGRFDAHFEYTDSLTKGFLSLRAQEASTRISPGSVDPNWCARVQTNTIAVPSAVGPYTAALDVVKSITSLPTAHPSQSGNAVKVVSYASYNLNPIDVSTVPVAAKSLTCEMISADSIALANKKTGAGGKPPPANQCQAANDAAIAAAEAGVSAKTLSRFKANGQHLLTVPDTVTTTGVTFLSSSLGFDTKSTPASVNVQGVSLATATSATVFPGVYECVLLSPAKAAEWMMVDGLPKIGS